MNGARLGSSGQEDLEVGEAAEDFCCLAIQFFFGGRREAEAVAGMDGSFSNTAHSSHSPAEANPGEQQSHPTRN